MFICSGRKILLGVVTGTLLSTAVTAVVVAGDATYHLIDSQGQPVKTSRPEECVETPRTPNTPPKKFKICGDVGDRDNDGILDDVDICPDNSAVEISKGVDQSGPRKGCPIDTDSDGVADYRDDCPNNSPLEISAGVYDDAIPLGRPENRAPQNSNDQVGCPLDMDQDCVPDYRDDCRQTPYEENLCNKVLENGCLPAVDTVTVDATSEALFAFDSAELTPHFKGVIDELIGQYRADADRIEAVEVVGHTDPVGTREYNQRLSEKRAASVIKYAVSRGVPRDMITGRGVGETDLVEQLEDESKSAWYRRCRRVVATVRYVD